MKNMISKLSMAVATAALVLVAACGRQVPADTIVVGDGQACARDAAGATQCLSLRGAEMVAVDRDGSGLRLRKVDAASLFREGDTMRMDLKEAPGQRLQALLQYAGMAFPMDAGKQTLVWQGDDLELREGDKPLGKFALADAQGVLLLQPDGPATASFALLGIAPCHGGRDIDTLSFGECTGDTCDLYVEALWDGMYGLDGQGDGHLLAPFAYRPLGDIEGRWGEVDAGWAEWVAGKVGKEAAASSLLPFLKVQGGATLPKDPVEPPSLAEGDRFPDERIATQYRWQPMAEFPYADVRLSICNGTLYVRDARGQGRIEWAHLLARGPLHLRLVRKETLQVALGNR